MKVLTATTRTQGQRDSDFTWCTEGELVKLPGDDSICDAGHEDPDEQCGCARSFAGLTSHRGTTTALVTDGGGHTLADLAKAAGSDEAARRIAEIAARFDVGDVLEVRLGEVSKRTAADLRGDYNQRSAPALLPLEGRRARA